MDLAVEIIGWTGAALLLFAYFLVSTRGKPPGPVIQTINGIGAIALIVNGAAHRAWPSVGLNIVWLLVAIAALALLLRAPRTGEPATPGGREE